jgi:hypothetical protein
MKFAPAQQLLFHMFHHGNGRHPLCKQALPPLFAKSFDVLLLEVIVYSLNCHHYRTDDADPNMKLNVRPRDNPAG